jgi:hypothetical protein
MINDKVFRKRFDTGSYYGPRKDKELPTDPATYSTQALVESGDLGPQSSPSTKANLEDQ